MKNEKKFDLIIIDLFIDTKIPDSFHSHYFWQHIIKATSLKGSILFNASLRDYEDKKLASII